MDEISAIFFGVGSFRTSKVPDGFFFFCIFSWLYSPLFASCLWTFSLGFGETLFFVFAEGEGLETLGYCCPEITENRSTMLFALVLCF